MAGLHRRWRNTSHHYGGSVALRYREATGGPGRGEGASNDTLLRRTIAYVDLSLSFIIEQRAQQTTLSRHNTVIAKQAHTAKVATNSPWVVTVSWQHGCISKMTYKT